MKIDRKRITGYGLGGYTTMFGFAIFSMYSLYFFTDVVGISPATASVIVMIGTFWDAITDPFIGRFSDNLRTRWGRRRPIILATILPFGLVCWLMFTDFALPGIWNVIYFILLVMAFFTMQTLLDVPYCSLAADMTTDYDMRSKLSISRATWEAIAMIAYCYILSFVDRFTAVLGDEKKGWSMTCGFFAVISMIFMFLMWRLTAGCEEGYLEKTSESVAEKEKNILTSLRHAFMNRSFRYIMFMYALGIIAQAAYDGFTLYYYKNNLHLSTGQVTLALNFIWITSLLIMPLLNWLMLHFGKKETWVLSIGLMAAAFFLFPLFILKEGSIVRLFFYGILLAPGFQAFYLVPWAMIPDTVEEGELLTGERSEGFYFGLASCFQKVGSAVTIAVCGQVLTWIGYDGSLALQSASTMEGLKIALSIGCTVPLLISIVLAIKNPMTKKRHEEILAALEAQSQQTDTNHHK